ncbi:hypothetical protein BSM4216_1359 [Bacillus smithii]|jgi:hypothetical protein|nr:hypothetical protein BSM4216_1359 [Bacillus smithii]
MQEGILINIAKPHGQRMERLCYNEEKVLSGQMFQTLIGDGAVALVKICFV